MTITTSSVVPPDPSSSSSCVTLGVIRGERYCTACSFPLLGQPVTRDPRYNLLIVRCPECGTAASLLEYPNLSRWATRLAALLAVVYAITIFGLLAGTAMIVRAWSIEGQRVAAEVYSERIALAHQRHFVDAKIMDSLTFPAGSTPDQIKSSIEYTIKGMPPYTSIVDPVWYEATGRAQIAAEPAPWWPNARRLLTDAVIGAGLVAFAIGVLWATLLWHVPRRRSWIVALAATVPGLAWGTAFPGVSLVAWILWYAGGIRGIPNATPWLGLDMSNTWAARLGLAGYTPAGMLAWDDLFWTTWPVTAVGMLAACFVGTLVGRPLARFTLRLIVPPRLLGPISGLWTSDGLIPPRRLGF